MNLVKEKIGNDLNILMQHQALLSHTIDELLLFDTQLKTHQAELVHRKEALSCLHILCENGSLFSSWINLERQVCQKKLDMIFAGLNRHLMNEHGKGIKLEASLLDVDKGCEDIWACSYSDVDKMKPPHCAESFMSMINAISGIYQVPSFNTEIISNI